MQARPCPGAEGFAESRALDRRFLPAMDETTRSARRAGRIRAVEATPSRSPGRADQPNREFPLFGQHIFV
ncbi:MAG: hypothetical protein D6754_08830 [Alphaproteobacteria bacterium]|nr:MAG: hypothetical protein D6754_08830 [Alphaproteobacteria bacterium]